MSSVRDRIRNLQQNRLDIAPDAPPIANHTVKPVTAAKPSLVSRLNANRAESASSPDDYPTPKSDSLIARAARFDIPARNVTATARPAPATAASAPSAAVGTSFTNSTYATTAAITTTAATAAATAAATTATATAATATTAPSSTLRNPVHPMHKTTLTGSRSMVASLGINRALPSLTNAPNASFSTSASTTAPTTATTAMPTSAAASFTAARQADDDALVTRRTASDTEEGRVTPHLRPPSEDTAVLNARRIFESQDGPNNAGNTLVKPSSAKQAVLRRDVAVGASQPRKPDGPNSSVFSRAAVFEGHKAAVGTAANSASAVGGKADAGAGAPVMADVRAGDDAIASRAAVFGRVADKRGGASVEEREREAPPVAPLRSRGALGKPAAPAHPTSSNEAAAAAVASRAALFEKKVEKRLGADEKERGEFGVPAKAPLAAVASAVPAVSAVTATGVRSVAAVAEKTGGGGPQVKHADISKELAEVKAMNTKLVKSLLELTDGYRHLEASRDSLQKRVSELEASAK